MDVQEILAAQISRFNTVRLIYRVRLDVTVTVCIGRCHLNLGLQCPAVLE